MFGTALLLRQLLSFQQKNKLKADGVPANFAAIA